MDKKTMLQAFREVDRKLKSPVNVIVGGGAAMLLAYGVPLATHDIDGFLTETSVTAAEFDLLVKAVASEMKINPQWFNSFFDSFTYTIPPDYKERLAKIYKGKFLQVSAFGKEDLLVMKCFSGREKDIGHAKAILKRGVDLEAVEAQIENLKSKGVPNAQKAIDFLEDVCEQAGM